MKSLFFDAVARHPKTAKALEQQAFRTLRPFRRFLGQAIHTAKERQTRYQLPWEPVRSLMTIHLDAVDSVLRVPRRRAGVTLTEWPERVEPDFDQPAFVINRGVTIRVERAHRTSAGLHVVTDVALTGADRVAWCGAITSVAPDDELGPPRVFTNADGTGLPLRGEPRLDDEQRHWLLVIEGNARDGALLVDGERVDAEALPADLPRTVTDSSARMHALSAGALRVSERPAAGLLRGDNGLRYRWREGADSNRRGNWIQLLLPESTDAEETIDPRAAFCEGEVTEVWTQPRRDKDTTFKVKKVDQDRYQLLLDRLPPTTSSLFLPLDLRNLLLQRRALRQLAEAPLPHHQGLLRLCEDPEHVHWPPVVPVSIAPSNWRALTDPSRHGTDEQQAFVAKALGTPDFAFLEGPPGSGKTTAICEIVQQLVEQGQRVLLCASTHVAIDNVLERLLASASPIDAVRIGHLDKVDDNVRETQLAERVQALVTRWRAEPTMAAYRDELEAMAERSVVMAANLTCGTTMGIIAHPLFRARGDDVHIAERPITTAPHWDVLIVDEASKTLIQEFLVPALMARRWIIVGDVRQLPPFTDRADIVANLRDLVDEREEPLFPRDHQRACLLLYRLLRNDLRQTGMRWLIVERPGVLEWLANELEHEPAKDLSVVQVAGQPAASKRTQVDVVTVDQLRSGHAASLRLASADWVLVADDLLPDVARQLPSNLLVAEHLSPAGQSPSAAALTFLTRQGWWLSRAGALPRPYRAPRVRRDPIDSFAVCQDVERHALQARDHASELVWRLTRLHELRHGHDAHEREKLRRAIDRLMPHATDISEPIAEIEDIGLPSILEVLQEGIGKERASRRSALTEGFRGTRRVDFDARFRSLTFQHRMHDDIASFPREHIYRGRALKNANTIVQRDGEVRWDFGSFPARRTWADVRGREQGGVNVDEIKVMAALVRDMVEWARRKGPPARKASRVWEVACLTFYVKQEREISEMLRDVTRDDRRTRFEVEGAHIEIVCATVDRFQGREADLVLLSLRNTGRVGFLDSPNRLNVAVTRARQQLVVIGHREYFATCRIAELEALAKSPAVDERTVQRWRRGT